MRARARATSSTSMATIVPIPRRVCNPRACMDRRKSSRASSNGTTTDGRGVALEDYVIYELHVGTFTHEGTFDADHRASRRARKSSASPRSSCCRSRSFPARATGATTASTSARRRIRTAVRRGLKRLVDACHARGLALLLDVVYNHLGPEGNYLARVRSVLHRSLQNAVGTGAQFRRPAQRRRALVLHPQRAAMDR